jgi:hypothetical protein
VTDLLPVEPDSLALESDPTAYMLTALNRAKGWLEQAQSIESVRDAKAIAVGYESVIREKEMAFDAQLAATEIVRRCERRIGELVRVGQERGEIRKRGDDCRTDLVHRNVEGLLSPREATRIASASERTLHYAMADAPDEQFEQAIAEARDEGNLSRANVVRKVKGEPAPKTARDPIHYRTRHVDPVRVLRESSITLDGVSMALNAIAGLALDDEGRQWLDAASASLQQVSRRLHNVRRKGAA